MMGNWAETNLCQLVYYWNSECNVVSKKILLLLFLLLLIFEYLPENVRLKCIKLIFWNNIPHFFYLNAKIIEKSNNCSISILVISFKYFFYILDAIFPWRHCAIVSMKLDLHFAVLKIYIVRFLTFFKTVSWRRLFLYLLKYLLNDSLKTQNPEWLWQNLEKLCLCINLKLNWNFLYILCQKYKNVRQDLWNKQKIMHFKIHYKNKDFNVKC